MPGRRAQQPTPIFLPGESQGQGSLAGYSPQGGKESIMTELVHTPRNVPVTGNRCSLFNSKETGGLPWWYSGQESLCQCRGHGFCPYMPHATERLSPPMLLHLLSPRVQSLCPALGPEATALGSPCRTAKSDPRPATTALCNPVHL